MKAILKRNIGIRNGGLFIEQGTTLEVRRARLGDRLSERFLEVTAGPHRGTHLDRSAVAVRK